MNDVHMGNMRASLVAQLVKKYACNARDPAKIDYGSSYYLEVQN